MIVNEIDAHKTMCPWNDFKGCYGSRCMAWVKAGRSQERYHGANATSVPTGLVPRLTPTDGGVS